MFSCCDWLNSGHMLFRKNDLSALSNWRQPCYSRLLHGWRHQLKEWCTGGTPYTLLNVHYASCEHACMQRASLHFYKRALIVVCLFTYTALRVYSVARTTSALSAHKLSGRVVKMFIKVVHTSGTSNSPVYKDRVAFKRSKYWYYA